MDNSEHYKLGEDGLCVIIRNKLDRATFDGKKVIESIFEGKEGFKKIPKLEDTDDICGSTGYIDKIPFFNYGVKRGKDKHNRPFIVFIYKKCCENMEDYT